MNQALKIGIIIVNYKDYAQRFLYDCIETLRKQEGENLDCQLYIIDNSSSEETREYLKKQAPEAKIIPRSDGNYSAANGAGIEQAGQNGCEYFVIVNMDVVFNKNWLSELVKAVNSDEQVGIAQSKVMLWPEKDKINSVGNVINFLGFGFTQGYREKNKEIEEIEEIKGYASGCSMIIKLEVIEKIGNYDSEYYMYHDDVELGWRTKLAGYKIVLAPKSVVYHKYEFSRSVRMLYYMERNRYIAILSFYKLPTILLVLPPLVIMDLGMLAYSIINGWFGTKLKVYLYFLQPKNWQHIFQVRQQVKKFRQVSDRVIIKNIAGIIDHQEIMNPVLKYIVNPVFNLYWKFIRVFIVW
ncbi:MAG: glycosyltransferase family 2 protein [Patescibacteria group bacterium]|jgi:hypothetical protein